MESLRADKESGDPVGQAGEGRGHMEEFPFQRRRRLQFHNKDHGNGENKRQNLTKAENPAVALEFFQSGRFFFFFLVFSSDLVFTKRQQVLRICRRAAAVV